MFGAISHCFELEDPLSQQELSDLEAQLGVRLPGEYRSFLLEVGAGGAGPSYGLFPVRKAEDGGWGWVGISADMTDLTLVHEPFPGCLDEAVLAALFEDEPDEDRIENGDDYDSLYEAWELRMAETMFPPERTAGAVCVCDHGCALRSWLVVTGPERGRIWYDGRADGEDMSPLSAEGDPVTFERWYLDWLSEAEAKISRER